MSGRYIGRARNLLTVQGVPEFRAWLEARGWVWVLPISADEVLRMGHEGRIITVTQRRGARMHVTVSGYALELAQQFIADRQAARPPRGNRKDSDHAQD
jgi:hypothetical protein